MTKDEEIIDLKVELEDRVRIAREELAGEMKVLLVCFECVVCYLIFYLLRNMIRCMGLRKEVTVRDMRCDVFVLLIYFSVVVRMDSQMGGSSGAKVLAAGPYM